jgi:hypothetical protein
MIDKYIYYMKHLQYLEKIYNTISFHITVFCWPQVNFIEQFMHNAKHKMVPIGFTLCTILLSYLAPTTFAPCAKIIAFSTQLWA